MTTSIEIIDRVLLHIENAVIATLSLIALAIGVIQIVLRYLFSTGFHWSESLFILATVTAMLFAGSRAIRDNVHVRIDLMSQRLTLHLAWCIELIVHAISLGLCLLFACAGYRYVTFMYETGAVSPDNNLPYWLIYTVVPITMTFFVLRYLIELIRMIRHRP